MEQGKPYSATERPLVDFDAVCQQVRAAVEPARAHAVSLHDQHGDVLWLSESAMGPDEHNAVREAIETFAKADSGPVLAFDLGDARSAVLVRAVNTRRALVGAVMVVLDSRVIKDALSPVKLMTPKLQRALANFAGMRPDIGAPTAPAAPRSVAATAPGKPLSPRTATSSPARVPAAGPGPMTARPARAAASPLAPASPSRATPAAARLPERPAHQSELSEKRPSAIPPEIDRLHAALRRSPIALHVQRLVPLTKGSQLRRYEVLLRSKSEEAPNAAPHAMLKAAVDNGLGSMIDRRVITELVGWLVHHPDVWQTSAAMFSVNLTATALHDEHFIKFVGLCLAKSSLPRATIAFELDVATAVKLSNRVTEVASSLHRLGCPVVLDDFALKTECFDLLRLPGIRYVKLAPEMTTKMRTDKISQASITAIVQMARVLGMHTVAKRTETPAEQEWLTALGVDFVQSHAMSPPTAIESLSKVQKSV
jgi:EAL domain-containing protein (putative c-di-GMP-specific phosphodiesterase class I)